MTLWTPLGEPVMRAIGKRDHKLRRVVLCRCACGLERFVRVDLLQAGTSQGCRPCRARKNTRAQTHGDTKRNDWSAEYTSWAGMLQRCTNPKHPRYADYGGRGITVCDRWLQSFEIFVADMGRKPSPELSLDRIDNDGNYEPNNCRWATPTQQRHNRRR